MHRRSVIPRRILQWQYRSASNTIRPRAANPIYYQRAFEAALKAPKQKATVNNEIPHTVAHHLVASHIPVPSSNWIHVTGIPPITSLTSIVEATENVLNQQVVLNLEAPWKEALLEDSNLPILTNNNIRQVRLQVSALGRPNGWYIELDSRSAAHAILSSEAPGETISAARAHQAIRPTTIFSDATVRLEGCPKETTIHDVWNWLVPYGLRDEDPIQSYTSSTIKIPPIFLVHCQSPSWARAVVRDLQGRNVGGRRLTVAPYPAQRIVQDDE